MQMPELDDGRPYCVLATMDGNDTPRWWIRQPDRTYLSWPGTSWPRVAEWLTPVARDFHVYTGDPIAIAECWAARELATKEKTP